MTESIVPQLPDSIAKEFSLGEDGKGFVSRRGLARLCGKRISVIQSLLKSIGQNTLTNSRASKGLQTFIGQSFQGDLLPDILASAIVKYYAYKGSETDTFRLTISNISY
jgi:hypothetical protein